jgi:hypothetical protein
MRLNSRSWFEWVPSAKNIADGPTRGNYTVLESLGAKRIRFVFPPVLNGWLS